jgi:hypothetical protein
MPVRQAVHSYTNERLNCAQSILKAFRERKNLSNEAITEARKLGGGRADQGTCGALHAAVSLLDGPEQQAALRRAFAEVAGSEQCREIKAKQLISCQQCVEVAARLLSTTAD